MGKVSGDHGPPPRIRSPVNAAGLPPNPAAALALQAGVATPWLADLAAIEGAAAAAVAALAALAEAPLVISGLLAAAGLGPLLYPSHLARREPDNGPQGLDPRAEPGLVPPPPTPPLPGLVPPVPGPKPGEGGFTPASSAPPLPGFTPAPSPRLVLPGQTIEEPGPIILQQTRNEGLEGGLRANSRRARKAAKVSDPAVTKILKDDEWVAHHLVNLATVRALPELFAATGRAGLDTDDPSNVVALPKTLQAQAKLKAAGVECPLHDSGHSEWNEEAIGQLRKIQRELKDSGLDESTEAYARAARDGLTTLMRELHQKMLGLKRVTQNDDPAPAPAPA